MYFYLWLCSYMLDALFIIIIIIIFIIIIINFGL